MACADSSYTYVSLYTNVKLIEENSDGGTAYIEYGCGKGAHIPNIVDLISGPCVLYEVDTAALHGVHAKLNTVRSKKFALYMKILENCFVIPLSYKFKDLKKLDAFHHFTTATIMTFKPSMSMSI